MRPANGVLDVSNSAFNATGNPGEYSFDNAVFSTIYDPAGAGAYGIAVGFVLYFQSMSAGTGETLAGVAHRYKINSLTVIDSQTISGTMVWDEVGPEQEMPFPSVGIISEPTPNRSYGYAALEQYYPTLPTGLTILAMLIDQTNISDQITGGSGSGSGSVTYTHTQTTPSPTWTAVHGKGSSNFTFTAFDSSGQMVMPDTVVATDNNTIVVTFAAAISGRLCVAFC